MIMIREILSVLKATSSTIPYPVRCLCCLYIEYNKLMLQEEGDSIGSAGSLAQPRSVPEVWGEEGELSGCPDQGCDHFDDHGVDHFDDQGILGPFDTADNLTPRTI